MVELERRFQDQDVREYPGLRDHALAYLMDYEGEFNYLREMQARVDRGQLLTDAMVRGVLNCMAGDPRVDMPGLEEPRTTAYGNVVAFKKPRRKGRARSLGYPCPLFANGIFHHHKRSEPYDHEGTRMNFCPGLYRINRTMPHMPVTVKTPFVAARGGSVVHKATGIGEGRWYIEDIHRYGWATYRGVDGPCELTAQIVCQIRWVTKPRLLWSSENVPDWRATHQADTLPLCKRCFPKEI